MSQDRLSRLRKLTIAQPCHEDWEAMEGSEKKRFCQGCGCFVHNVSAMTADEAEATLSEPGRVCTRVTTDPARGVLTRSGWVARLLTAGVAAAAVSGCSVEPSSALLTPDSLAKVDAHPAGAKPAHAEPGETLIGKIAQPTTTMMGDTAKGAVMPNPAKSSTVMGAPVLPSTSDPSKKPASGA